MTRDAQTEATVPTHDFSMGTHEESGVAHLDSPGSPAVQVEVEVEAQVALMVALILALMVAQVALVALVV